MNIKELIKSSGNIYHRGKSFALSKQLGKILLNNKMVTVYRNQTVVDVSMIISGVTDMIKVGDSKKAVAFHKATISFKGIDQTYYSPSEFVAEIRRNHPKYADKEKWPDPDVKKAVLDAPTEFFKDATVFQTTNDSNHGFSVVSNNISENCEIQVWCSCSDYYWTMQYYNCENDVDKYKRYPKRYIPKTKAGYEAFKQNQPLRNPSRSPGMCKHLMLLLATLMEEGLVQDSSNMGKYYKANYHDFQIEQRVDPGAYEKRLEEWSKDQGIKRKQRTLERNKAGYRKTGWNRKTQSFTQPGSNKRKKRY